MQQDMRSALKQKKDFIIRELDLVGEDTPVSDFERSNLLVQMVSKFGQIIRRVSLGDYRDELAQANPELRIKYHISEITRQLQSAINLKVPDFDSASYSSNLAENLASMRGRELPGFASARLLMGSVFVDLENLRSEVDEALFRAADVFMISVNKLAERIAENFPLVRVALMEVVEKCCTQQSADMSRRSVEIFERSTGGAINDKEMILSINQIRWDRFDSALEDSLSSAREAFRGGSSKEDLKRHFKSRLGPAYMQNHAVGDGVVAQLDDAKAALKAYWRVSEARLLDDVTSCIDMVLLQSCPALIEQALMTEVQNWMSMETLGQMLNQDPQICRRRMDLKEQLRRTEHSNSDMDELSNSSNSVSNRLSSLSSSGIDSDVRRQGEGDIIGMEKRKTENILAHGDNPPRGQGLSIMDTTDAAGNKDAAGNRPGTRAPDVTSVAVFTYQSDRDDNGLVYWLGTRGHSQPFRSPMSFGQLDVQSSGVHIGSRYGNENALVSRATEEVRLINTPSCWICVDVGRTRAISPTRLCVVHGSSQQGCDITNWDAEGRDLDSLEWTSLTLSENGMERSCLGSLPSENKVASYALNARGKTYSQIRLISTGLQMDGVHSLSLRSIELYGVFYRVAA